MQTFDVLDPEMDILGRYFLEASAGTGKTFAIENLIPRIILESKEPIRIDEILVVTFTRAATRELKARIYKNLKKVSFALQEGKGGPKYLEKIFAQGRDALQRAKIKIEEACFSFEQAQIFTLHGFALSILQEFAFEAKFFSEETSLLSIDPKKDLQKYIQDFLRVGLEDKLLSPSQMKKVAQQKRIGKNSKALSNAVIQLLEKGQSIRSYATSYERWMDWNEVLSSLPSVTKEEIQKEYHILAPRLAQSKKWKNQLDWFASWIENKYCSFEEWDGLLQEKELFFSQASFVSKIKKSAYTSIFEALQKLIPSHEEATDPKTLLLQLAKGCEGYYGKGKKDSSAFTPDDFIEKLKIALEQPSFQEKVKHKYKALVIDEFQDTDASQWKIFQTLFLAENPCPVVYLVGDPKQSIYGFRNADVYIYLKAKKFFAKDHHFYLGTNFRSHPELVEALNAFFSLDLPFNWMTLPLSEESLEVTKVAHRPFYSSMFKDEGKKRIHFLLFEEREGTTKHFPSIETEEEVLLPFIAKEILRLKNLGLKYHQIAVLVKDRFQADRVQKIFFSHGIPCEMQKKLDEKGVVFELMKNLLDCLLHPSDISSLKKFLGGVLIGYTEEEVQGSWENSILQQAREYFALSRELVKKKGFGVFFQDFLMSSSKQEGKTIADFLLSSNSSSIYFGMRQLCQILLEYAGDHLHNPKKILAFLEKLQEEKPPEILQKFFEQEEDQVHVMTLHKSKGLEFDIVFALGLSSRYTGKEEYISVRREEGKELAVRKDEESILYLEEMDAEKLRQLYVALTRAKERVYIPAVFVKDLKEIAKGTASPLELFLGGKGLSSYQFAKVYQNINGLTLEKFLESLIPLMKEAKVSYEVLSKESAKSFTEDQLDLVVLQEPPLCEQKFPQGFLLSFSSLVEEKEKSSSVLFEEKISLEAENIPLGSKTGTIVHEILETLCKAGLHQDPLSIHTTVQQKLEGSFLQGKEEAVIDMVQGSIEALIITMSARFSLKDIPSSDMKLEMEFLYPVGDSLLKGFIDLIFRFQGKYYLLDWKTNALGEYNKETMYQCMIENGYDLQAAIYTVALQKFLSLFDKRPFKQIFGGAIYFFLRGKSPLFFFPDTSLAKNIQISEAR